MEIIKKFEPLFGEWYVEDIIGAGSFGRVYKIYREELGNRFYSALKYISLPADSNEMKQLRADGMDEQSISAYYFTMARDISSETTLMNKLRGNTNIVSFEDSKVVPKPNGIGYDIFIRMELLDSLTNRMVEKALSINEVAKLGIDICTALMLCAKYGIIHRDIKPDNIFISPNGDYKLGDFGIARQLEKTATFMSKKGTYNYMAPEVYKGEKYGATCDLYSLGLVMYRLLNKGRLPFLPEAPNPITANDREEALKRRFTGEKLPAPCNADEELSAIVLKACAYDPKDRFASAEAMRTALLHYGSGEYSDMSGAIMVNDSTEGTEDGPTESVFTDDSSVDAEEDGETLGVLGGIPPVANKAFEQPVQPSEPSVKAQLPQKPAADTVPETPENVSPEPAAPSAKKKRKKKTRLFIGIAAALLVCIVGTFIVFHLLDDSEPTEILDDSEPTEILDDSEPTEILDDSEPTETPVTVSEPTETPVTVSEPTETPVTVSVGDIITFGRYEQDNNIINGKEDIEWIVLAKADNRILIISKYALDCRPYNTSYTDVTWETCTLRKWLNNNFINSAFTADEKAMIPTVTVSAYKNPNYSTNPGNATQDQVFLLSITEANKYFSSDSARQCKATEYAVAGGAYVNSDNGNCWWWLRSPGYDPPFAATVLKYGHVYEHGYYVDIDYYAVRPALWIDLNS